MDDESLEKRVAVIVCGSLGMPVGRAVDLFAQEVRMEFYKVPERDSFEDWHGNRRRQERRLQHQVRSKRIQRPQRR